MRAWFSICTAPSGGEELLDQVVLLVVERGAAEVGEPERARAAGAPSPRACSSHVRARVATTRSAIMSIAVSRSSSSHSRAVGAPVLDPVLAHRAVHELLGRRPLRAEPAARDRAVGVALDLDDPARP